MPKAIEMKQRTSIRAFEVRGAVGDASLHVRWERWDGDATADGASQKDGTPLRPDNELALSFRQLSSPAQWGVGEHGRAGLLSGTDLDVRVIRGYAALLDQLATEVETAMGADAPLMRKAQRRPKRH